MKHNSSLNLNKVVLLCVLIVSISDYFDKEELDTCSYKDCSYLFLSKGAFKSECLDHCYYTNRSSCHVISILQLIHIQADPER